MTILKLFANAFRCACEDVQNFEDLKYTVTYPVFGEGR